MGHCLFCLWQIETWNHALDLCQVEYLSCRADYLAGADFVGERQVGGWADEGKRRS